MGASYEIWLLYHADGHVITLIDAYSELEYTSLINGVGSFTLTLPASFDISLVQLDTRVAIWRRPAGGARMLDFVGLVRYIEKTVKGNSKYYIISGPDLNDFLDRRIIAYAAGSAQSDKANDYADDLIKAFVRENLGALCTDTDRDISLSGFTVEADRGQCTQVAKACAWRNLLTVLQEVAEASMTTPTTAAFFGIVPLGNGWDCEFRTNVQQWGNDRRYPGGVSGPIVFSLDYGNLANVTRNINARDEKTYIYAGGSGTEATRVIGEAEDATREGASPFNRCEDFYNSSNTDDADQLQSQADAELRERRPRELFSASVVNVGNVVYGRDYGLGDYVTAVFDGEVIDCQIASVAVKITGDTDNVNIRLRVEA